MRKASFGILAAIALLVCVPASSSWAQGHGGGGHMGGGAAHGGGAWHGGGGGAWHGGGGGAWHGGGGGAWHGGGGWHGGGWHGGTHVVVGIGAPFWGWGWGGWPYYYGPGYYPYYGYGYDPYAYGGYYPPAVVVQPQQAQPLPSGYWYFCPSSNDYYPHVQSCDQPWVPVPPTPSE
jgi:hypothetical protein